MRRARTFRIAAVAAVAFAAIAAFPALAASPGAVAVTGPRPQSILGDEALVTWAYSYGTVVTSTSRVDVASSTDGTHWKTLATNLPLRSGYVWDTSALGSAKYWIKVQVLKTTVRSVVSPLIIDHQPPVISITNPRQGDVPDVNGANAPVTVVSGRMTLQADARDAISGVANVVWMLDDAEIGEGQSTSYNFDQVYGQHTLVAIAIDRAGNVASSTLTVQSAPGAQGAMENLGVDQMIGNLGSAPSVPSPSATVPSVPSPSPCGSPLANAGGLPSLPIPKLP